MRSWLPQRPLTGPEIVGIVVVSFMVVPFLIAAVASMVTALASWPAAIGLIAGAGGALIVQRRLAREVVVGRRRIAELDDENAQLRQQVEQLKATVDRFIDGYHASK